MGRVRVDCHSLSGGFITQSGGRHDYSCGTWRSGIGWLGAAGSRCQNLLPAAQGHAGSCRSHAKPSAIAERTGAIPITVCPGRSLGACVDPPRGADIEGCSLSIPRHPPTRSLAARLYRNCLPSAREAVRCEGSRRDAPTEADCRAPSPHTVNLALRNSMRALSSMPCQSLGSMDGTYPVEGEAKLLQDSGAHGEASALIEDGGGQPSAESSGSCDA